MTVENLRKKYPIGTLIRCISMDDPRPIPPGTIGEVTRIDDAGQIHMKWDNGRTLALVPGVDCFSKVG